MKPLVIDLFCGRFGWSKGFLSEGYRAIGFDLEQMGPIPEGAELVLQDVLTLHGSQFRDAACIVASPPCQRYSYMAMPWSIAKREAAWQRWERDSPFGNFRLNDLFDACFRIKREANEAVRNHCIHCGFHLLSHHRWCGCECPTFEGGTRYIPLVVENVKGAQPWVGEAKAHFGSYYLWGDIDTVNGNLVAGLGPLASRVPYHPPNGRAMKSIGGQNANGELYRQSINKMRDAFKREGRNFHAFENGSGAEWWDKALDERRREATAIKNGKDWFGSGENCSLQRRQSSRSNSRKEASALIAEIPFDLAQWIARVYKPGICATVSA